MSETLIDERTDTTPTPPRLKYDHLFDTAETDPGPDTLRAEMSDLALNAVEVKVKDPRLQEVFAPLIAPEEPDLSFDYDVLFEKDEDIQTQAMAKIRARDEALKPVIEARRNYNKYVTDEAAQESRLRLLDVVKRDPYLRSILAHAGYVEPSIDAVKAIREDPELRYAVGEHLLDMLNKLIDMAPQRFGDRIVANGEKQNRAPEVVGPQKMKSREYVVLLAMAKLGGSFSRSIEKGDSGSRSGDTVITGQHRQAADLLLGLEETPVDRV